MRPNSLQLRRVRCRQHDCPVRRVERWEQRETITDQIGALGNEELTAVGDDRAQTGELLKVATRNLKNGESPNPTIVTLQHRALEAIIDEGTGTKSHHNKPRRRGLVPQNYLLVHTLSLPIGRRSPGQPSRNRARPLPRGRGAAPTQLSYPQSRQPSVRNDLASHWRRIAHD